LQFEKLQDAILNRRSESFQKRKELLDAEFDSRRKVRLFRLEKIVVQNKQVKIPVLEKLELNECTVFENKD
jgi:hypothetical protein